MLIKYFVKFVFYWLVINFNFIGFFCMFLVFFCIMMFDFYVIEYKQELSEELSYKFIIIGGVNILDFIF